MKWITHQAGAIVAGSILEFPIEILASAFVGSIVPDIIDQKISSLAPTRKTKQILFNQIHRGNSHWFGWWLGLFLLTMAYPDLPFINIGIGLAFGALSHVILDSLTTSGVPVIPFNRKNKLSLGFCSTGSFREYCFLGVLLVLGVIFNNNVFLTILEHLNKLVS